MWGSRQNVTFFIFSTGYVPTLETKKKNVEDLSENSLKTLKNKYKKAKAALKEQFSKSVAPGQHLQLADLLSSSSNDDNDDGSTDNVFMSNELKSMVSMYDASDKTSKAAILSVASKDHNKQESMNIFNCSKLSQ